MDNFIIAIESVIPMFTMIMLGLLAKKMKILKDEELPQINNFIFRILFPILMFSNIYDTDLSKALDVDLMVYTIGTILLIYIITVIVVLIIEKNNARRGAMIQAIYRSNFVLMGLPVAINICGSDNVGVTAIMVSIVVPLYNVLAVITLEVFRGGKINIKKVLGGIVNNPLILGALAGIFVMITGINIPGIAKKTISQISAAATPMALIVLGASFNFNSIGKSLRNLVISVVGRLVIVPAIALSIAVFIGFRGVAFVTLIGVFCAPCAVSSFTMAQQMDSDADLAAGTVVFTSVLACFTMFLWIFLFKQLGMF